MLAAKGFAVQPKMRLHQANESCAAQSCNNISVHYAAQNCKG